MVQALPFIYEEICDQIGDSEKDCDNDKYAIWEHCWHMVFEGPEKIANLDVDDYDRIYQELKVIAAGCFIWMEAISEGNGGEVNG